MRVLIVTSCTGRKVVSAPNALTLDDFRKGQEHVARRESEVRDLMRPAEDMYSGPQHLLLMEGVRAFRRSRPEDLLDLRILSAGYGLLEGSTLVAPYESTFQGMGRAELSSWARYLGVPVSFRTTVARPFDLGLVLLGDDYLEACELDASVRFGGPTIVFCGKTMQRRLPEWDGVRTVGLSNEDATEHSCGLVGLKGKLCSRVLHQLMGDDVESSKTTKTRQSSLRATPVRRMAAKVTDVDHVIDIPSSWSGKREKGIQYFIPEWDDLVDPAYDFRADNHSGGTGDWSNEVYAHQMFQDGPNYDGLLVSKVIAEKSKKKKERINRLGVHRFLRVPRDFPVMGDCGAFGYINEKTPPYKTPEILDYYTRLGFDFGVSIDHLIVASTEADAKARYDLTVENAAEFLHEHQKAGLPWTPIGAVQGWDPKSYADAARKYVSMGYKYIAFGGLVRSSTEEVLAMMRAVHEVVPSSVRIHLFGLARIRAMRQFADLGVTSVDSASFLRRAWLGAGSNYITLDGKTYSAIRIPSADKSFRAKRMVSEGRATMEQVRDLESSCLHAMNEFDAGRMGVDDALEVLVKYDSLISPDRPVYVDTLRRTLEARPWASCPCDICRKDGVQVVIFRGNNRNRRRGFHNTYAFYRLMERALEGEDVRLSGADDVDDNESDQGGEG